MIGPFGRQGLAATLRQQCPQMTQRRCMCLTKHHLKAKMPTNPDTMFQGSKDEFRPREGDPGGDGRVGQDVSSCFLVPTNARNLKIIFQRLSRSLNSYLHSTHATCVSYFACDKNPRERTNSDFFNPNDKQRIHYKCFPKTNM